MPKPRYENLTLDRAKVMRARQTPAEKHLWTLLRGNRLGARFRRQQPIGPFIADFYCAQHGLIVEADGPQHHDDPTVDAERTRWLEAKGYRVLRFDNSTVLNRSDEVMKMIAAAMTGPHPGASRRPSPSRGEGI